ncbi:hypothetical protein KUCAC02_025744 [Chaenocephalus aceratus]|uniref:Uncharacterized protein n=1 Tax=Chaenocephalus aceratus TaxID=36190 RepID=A0ACB9VW74_CHAAC|nr:hypothetical protein KUCAC02_025744 [Chaenocephalus aceratus]
MDKLDDVTVSIFKAAHIDEVLMHSLTRDDLRDLFPGPEDFLRRKRVWSLISPEELHLVENIVSSNPELTAMAKKVVEYYPMLQDKDEAVKHTTIHNRLKKRLLQCKVTAKEARACTREGLSKEEALP